MLTLASGVKPPKTKYIANPVQVEAFKLVFVDDHKNDDGSLNLVLDNGEKVIADKAMLARYEPTIGDYWVIQSDGYVYLNPREVFERKYHKAD